MYRIGDIVQLLPTAGADAGRTGKVKEVLLDTEDIILESQDGKPWIESDITDKNGCIFGFMFEECKVITPVLVKGDKVLVLEETFAGKKNINKKAKPGMRGIYMGPSSTNGKPLIKFGKEEHAVGLPLLQRIDKIKKKRVLDIQIGSVVVIKGPNKFLGLVERIADDKNSFVCRLGNGGTQSYLRNQIVALIPFINISAKLHKFIKIDKQKQREYELAKLKMKGAVNQKIIDKVLKEMEVKDESYYCFKSPTMNGIHNDHLSEDKMFHKFHLPEDKKRAVLEIKKQYIQFVSMKQKYQGRNDLVFTTTPKEGARKLFAVNRSFDLYDNSSVRQGSEEKGFVFASPGTFKQAASMTKQRNFINMDKIPLTKKKNYVGVEIEFYCDVDRSGLEKVLESVKRLVKITEDGSIHPPGRDDGRIWFPHEICVLDSEERILDTIDRIYKLLASVNAQVNHTCGLHVHLDMRNRKVKNVYNVLAKSYKFLASQVPADRRANRFCRPPDNQDMDEQIRLSREHYGQRDGRYMAINAEAYKRHKTLEIRLHHGSLDTIKVNHWIETLIAVANSKKISTQSEKLFLASLKPYSDGNRNYFETMSRQFA